jgi:hypothetical protein
MDTPLVCLVYASRAVRPLGETALQSLLEQARDHNVEAGLTGVLIYGDERFVQVLEGSDEAVHAVFSRIAVDPRHYAVRILADEPLAQRRFGSWSMGLRRARGAALHDFDGRLAAAVERAGSTSDGRTALNDLLPIVQQLLDGTAP